MLAQPEHKEEPEMSGISATVGLLAATVVTCFCADYCAYFHLRHICAETDCFSFLFPCLSAAVVASLKEFAVYYRATESFISIILLPNVANAARHLTSVWMAMTLRMELTIAICVGGSIVCHSHTISCVPETRVLTVIWRCVAHRHICGLLDGNRRLDIGASSVALLCEI